MLALTVATATEHAGSLDGRSNRTELKPDATKERKCENAQSVETDRSHYFLKNSQQHRLGEDFFKQPCIRLAKAILGKVMLPPSIYIHF